MNRTEFMKQLEALLQNIPLTEREEALQYYNDYFDDAGEENEQNVIEALGSPAKVAENIKRDLYGSGYDDTTYQRTPVSEKTLMEYRQPTVEQTGQSSKMPTGVIVLIVILCVLASPILLGVGGGVLGVLFGLVASWVALIVAFGITAVALLITLIVLIIVSFMCMVTSPMVGIVVLGIGLICGGLGILFLMLTVAMAGIATPAIFRGIVWLCRKMAGK